jgi:hypothetical protein
LVLLVAFCDGALAQQPTSTAPIFQANAQYLQGRTWADYKASAGAALTLNIAAGTVWCQGVSRTYAGGTLTMTNAATNYVYLDTAASCIPAKSTSAFPATGIPVATVVAAGGAITTVTDSRSLLTLGGGSSSALPSTVKYAESYAGANLGPKVNACLAAVIALGGGTCDARGLAGAQTITEDVIVGTGWGSNPFSGAPAPGVKLLLPSGTIARGTVPATGKSAQFFYRTGGSIIGQGEGYTTITGANDTVAVQSAPGNSPSNVHLSGFSVTNSGTVTEGSATLGVSGFNLEAPVPVTSATRAFNSFGVLSPVGWSTFWTGRLAHYAIYPTALSPGEVAAHYAARTDIPTYNAAVAADGATNHWPMGELSGTTATDIIGGTNGTYTGGVVLGSGAGISGASGDFAAVLNGTTGYVSIPSGTWLSSGTWTIEGWGYPTTSTLGDLFGFNPDDYLPYLANYIGANPTQFISTDAAQNTLKIDQTNTSIAAFVENQWLHWVYVYQGGKLSFYENGVPIPFGGDVQSSHFEEIATGGADIGVKLDSTGGCICYNTFTNVNPGGVNYGAKVTNSSGFAFGVNQNQWTGGRFGGAVGLYESGSTKNTYNYLDFENNNSNSGAVLYAGPDGNDAGLGYAVGDTVRPAGGAANAVLTVTAIGAGGYVTALAPTTRGTGYGNVQSVATTTLTGAGTGLDVDLRVSGSMLLLSGGGTLVNSPYEEAGGGDYIGGSFNTVAGVMGSGAGSAYSATYATGPTGTYGGPLSNFTWGPGAIPNSIGVKDSIVFGGSQMFDGGYGTSGKIQRDGPSWTGVNKIGYGHGGHSDWHVGLLTAHSGISSTGLVTVSKIADPAAPTVTAYGGTGTPSDIYALVCTDRNGGVTLPGAFSAPVSGPAVLGAILTATVYSGGTGYTVGDYPTLTGGDGTGQVEVTSVDSITGAATGLSVYVAGSEYIGVPGPGWGTGSPYSVTGGTGTGLKVTITSTYMKVVFPVVDGCYSWTVLKADTAHSIYFAGNGTTDASVDLIDFGGTIVAYSPVTRNTTGDVSIAGALTLGTPLASASGGTGNGWTKFTGPTTAEKTFTLPDASATIITGTATTAGRLIAASGAGAVAEDAALTVAAGVLTATGFSGPLTGAVTGNASTATDLAAGSILGSAKGGTANGFTKFTGPTTAEKTFTLPDANATILTSGTVAPSDFSAITAQTVVAGPSAYGAAAAAPTARAIAIQDIPTLALAAFDNQILTSAVDASGNPAFLTVNAGLDLNILGGTTPVVMFIAGKWQTLSSNVVITLAASKNQFIYATQDVAAAAMVVGDFGASEYPPDYDYVAPAAPATDQHWFDLSTNTMKRYSGAAWVAFNRIFIGVVRTSGAAIDGIVCEPYRLSPQKRFELFGDASNGILTVTGATTVDGFKQYSFVRVDAATLTHTVVTMSQLSKLDGLTVRSQNPILIINAGSVSANGVGRPGGVGITGVGASGSSGGYYGGEGGGGGGAGATNAGGTGGGLWGLPSYGSASSGLGGGAPGGAVGAGGTSADSREAVGLAPGLVSYLHSNGAGGGAGGGDGTKKGGNGGAGGGSVRVSAPSILIDATSSVTANGVTGSDGEAGGDPGGGAGGAGGVVAVTGGFVNNLGTISALGGSHGHGVGGGKDGGNGGNGTALTVRLW